jgi:hypothetical protein
MAPRTLATCVWCVVRLRHLEQRVAHARHFDWVLARLEPPATTTTTWWRDRAHWWSRWSKVWPACSRQWTWMSTRQALLQSSFSDPAVRAMHGSIGANCWARATTELACVGDVVIWYPHSALAAAGLVEHQSLRSNYENMEWIGGEILLPQIERCNGVCSATWQSPLMQADLWDCISTYASSVVETWVNPDRERAEQVRCGCSFGFDLEFIFDYVISFYYFLSFYFIWFLTFISAYAYGVRSRDAGGYRGILRKKNGLKENTESYRYWILV